MYDFYYNNLKKKYRQILDFYCGITITLITTLLPTDSFKFEIKTIEI